MRTKFNLLGKKLSAILISLFLVLIFFYGLWYFVFNIYEVKYEINFVKNLSDDNRLFEIENIPINLLGKKTPFRKLDFDYEIIEGGNLIDIVPRNINSELFFTTLHKKGRVTFILKTNLGLFPQRVEFDLSKNKYDSKLN